MKSFHGKTCHWVDESELPKMLSYYINLGYGESSRIIIKQMLNSIQIFFIQNFPEYYKLFDSDFFPNSSLVFDLE